MPPAAKRARRCGRRSWSDLPHDLLGDVLHWLTPAFGDRVRFRGVCRAWRAAERAHPRPPMPWLLAPGHCVSLHDAAIHRVPLPDDAAAAACRGSFDDWLALVPASGRPFLLNTFTTERFELPRWTKEAMSKIVLSSAPDTEGCTVAAIVDFPEDYVHYSFNSKIFVCRLEQRRRRGASAPGSWWPITTAFALQDIIFFEGKLHALDEEARIHVFEDGELERPGQQPWRPGRQVLPRFDDTKLYLVALHGRLHMVRRIIRSTRVASCTHHTCKFRVFAQVGDAAPKWSGPVKDFDGRAIFVGDACCGAFAVDAAAGGRVRANQICFVDDEKNVSSMAAACRRPFRMLQSYDVRIECLRMYLPREPWPAPLPGTATAMSSGAAAGAWRCVTVQRFPHGQAMGPPLRAMSAAELLLWDVMNCLGASTRPSYSSRKLPLGEAVTVQVMIPKTGRLIQEHVWSFTRRGRTARKAREAAAQKAAKFLRSRFRDVLDDSPWSSIPHYHIHLRVDDEGEEEEETDDEEDYWV